MSALLENREHKVRVAYNGKEALGMLANEVPDVVICDIGLPEMNGYELAGHLRKLLPQSLLISVSGWGREEDRQRSHEAGFEYHFVKPLQFEDLLKIIKIQRTQAAES